MSSMLLVVFYAFIFAITVNESLGCFKNFFSLPGSWHVPGSWRSLSLRQADDIAIGHGTFGVCSKDRESCLNKRYNSSNITEMGGTNMARLYLDSFDSSLLDNLTFPMVESMNCDELCNCLSCAPGLCEEDKEKCPGNNRGFICKCGNSESYPSINTIVMDMLSNGITCRRCDK